MSMATVGRGVSMVVMVAGALLPGLAAAADEPMQPLQAGGLKLKAPAAWKNEKPSSAMRQLQIKIPPAAGDKEPGEMTVFAFPNGAGSKESNIARWEKQFVDGEKQAPKAKVEEKKGTNVAVTRVEIAGRYVASAMPGVSGSAKADNPNYRLLGAIVETKDTGYFFKLVGPDKTLKEASKGFDAMIESMTLDK